MSEIQQVYELLSEINDMLGEVEQKTQALETAAPKLQETAMTAQQVTRILSRMNHLLAHMGLPKEIDLVIGRLQKMVFMLRMALMSINMLSMGTPYGMIFGLMGFASIAISAPSLMEGY